MTQVRTIARVLLDADGWMLTSAIAAAADMLDKPTHVSAIINNLRARDFIQSEKGVAGGNEQRHRAIEAARARFVAWVDRDKTAPPTRDSGTKRNAANKSAQMHRIDLATRKPAPTLSQMASAAERDSDKFSEVHGGVEHRVIASPSKPPSKIGGERAQTTIRQFCFDLSQVLDVPLSWLKVSISIDSEAEAID